MTVPRTGILDIPADKEHNRWILGHGFEMFGLRDPDKPFFLVISLEGPSSAPGGPRALLPPLRPR